MLELRAGRLGRAPLNDLQPAAVDQVVPVGGEKFVQHCWTIQGFGAQLCALGHLSRLGLLVAANVIAFAARSSVTLSRVVVPVELARLFRLADLVRPVAERLRGGEPAAADRR